MKDSISCILCCYGKAPFLAEQLASIAEQKIAVDQVQVFDDGLDSEGKELLRDSRFRFPVSWIKNENRKGIVGNFSEGLEQGSGTYLFLSDQDDVWLPNKVEQIVDRFEQLDQPDLVFSNASLIDEAGRNLGSDLWSRCRFDPGVFQNDPEAFFRHLLKRHVVTGATAAIRASARGYLLPVPDLMPVHLHDGWIALACAAQGKVAWIDESLMGYRQHSAQTLGAPRRSGMGWVRLTIGKYWGNLNSGWLQRLVDETDAWKRTRDALMARNLLSENQEALLQQKIDFLETRSRAEGRFRKALLCFRLWGKGDYHRFHHQPSGALITDLIHHC